MKQTLTVFIIFLIMLLCCSCGAKEPKGDYDLDIEFDDSEYEYTNSSGEGMTGIWLTVMELTEQSCKTQAEYEKKITTMAENCSAFGITDAFIQVRYGCDSIYPSKLFKPNSKFSENGKLNFDYFKIILQSFHKEKIKVHAWINPYRILASSHPEKDDPIFKSIKKDDIIFTSNGGSYIAPSSERGNRLILEGIREILSSYKVDGIHIDDYFYPENDESIDKEAFKNYTVSGGGLSLTDWRRSCVSSLISSIYSLVKSFSKDIVFSVSPSGDIDKNLSELYADVRLWCREEGYVDLMIPQIYYGFENSSKPFEKCLNQWRRLASGGKVKLAVGLAAYKAGQEDKYAGKGKNEWIENENILSSQAKKAFEKTDGIVLFSYSYLFANNNLTKNELKNLSSVVQSIQEEN